MTIQIMLDAHSIYEEFEQSLAEFGIKIVDRSEEPWRVVFEGERDALIAMVACHWAQSGSNAVLTVDSSTLQRPHQTKHEYAFDVTLQGVVRVVATDELKARAALAAIVDGMAPDQHWVDGFNGAAAVKVTEVSIAPDTAATIFEIDGKDVP